MFQRARVLPSTVALLLLSAPVLADRPGIDAPADSVEFPANLTGHGLKMNYGPCLSYSVLTRSGTTVTDMTLKGVTVRLGRKPVAALCFDTETFRIAAAWTGGYLDISRTNLNGYKGDDLGAPLPPVLFSTTAGPGWATTPTGEFVDPRPEFQRTGKGDGHPGVALPLRYGALPAEVARYRGLYLHGEKVIFSYTLGKTGVLDMPGMIVHDGQVVVTRTVRLEGHADDKTLLVCESTAGSGSLTGGAIALLHEKDRTIVVGVRGAPKGWALVLVGETRIHLKLPPSAAPVTFQVMVASADAKLLAALGAVGELPDLPGLCKGGPPRWSKVITLPGKRGSEAGPYQVDEITLPEPNPWGSWIRPGAFDFFADGRAAVRTWNGDVWVVSGLDDKLQAVQWRRYATGLFEPLGLRIVDDVVYVLGRDQITRLHDLNGDGEADYYECFNSSAPVAPTFHGFAMELHTDRAGNFYYSRGGHRVSPGALLHGGIIKVAKDGSTAELYCRGLREANGMSIGPGDLITVADNQGNWVPSSRLDVVKKGAFYGYNWGTSYADYEKPLCWIPMHIDNSSGGQAWVPSNRWGLPKGSMLHTSYGTCKLMLVLAEKVGEQWQGGVCVFPLTFSSGIMRARFSPVDGQLYLCGLKGWQTAAKQDGGFYRVRYTGKPVYMPRGLRVERGKLHLDFTCELDPRSAADTGHYAIEQWNYRWTGAYGSKDYSIANPDRVGRDKVEVKAVTLSPDGRTVTLEIPELRPVMQMGITCNLRAASGSPVAITIYNTISRIP